MHTITVKITLARNPRVVYTRVLLNGHTCASDVEYIENLFYFIRNRVLPTGRIPNMNFNPSNYGPEAFFYLLKP